MPEYLDVTQSQKGGAVSGDLQIAGSPGIHPAAHGFGGPYRSEYLCNEAVRRDTRLSAGRKLSPGSPLGEMRESKGGAVPPKVLCALCAAFLLLGPRASLAQTVNIAPNTPLSQILPEVYAQEILTNIDAFGLDPASAAADSGDALVITQAIGSQLSTFPLGSSAGGFSWTFDPSVGIFTSSTSSFGPIFAERALTVGRTKLNFGLNYQWATYDEFAGKGLRSREIVFFSPTPSGLIGEDALLLKVSAGTASMFANYGVTDRLDAGVVVPIVHASVDADLSFVFRDTDGSQVGAFETHTAGKGSKTGIGDIVLRGKYRVTNLRGGGIAAGLDLRLPSGDEDNLLGIPGTQAKVYGIASWTAQGISPHINIGYTFSRANDQAQDGNPVLLEPPAELNYAIGADIAVNSRITLAGDLVGRTLRDVARLAFGDVGLGGTFQEFHLAGSGNLNVPLASVGAKFNVWRNLLISGNLLFSLTSGGLRDKVTPVIGFDYSR